MIPSRRDGMNRAFDHSFHCVADATQEAFIVFDPALKGGAKFIPTLRVDFPPNYVFEAKLLR
jgi:hypothetical protein